MELLRTGMWTLLRVCAFPLVGVLTGCGSLFSARPQLVPCYIEDSLQVLHADGTPLTIVRPSFGSPVCELSYPEDNVLLVRRGSTFYRLRPPYEVGSLTLLGFFGLGVGAFVDNLTHSDMKYINLRADSALTLQPPVWSGALPSPVEIMDSPSAHQFRMLIVANVGAIYPLHEGGVLPADAGIGIGATYAHLIDIFGYVEEQGLLDLISQSENVGFAGTSTTFSLKSRIYPIGGLYVSGGVSRVRALSGDFNVDSGTGQRAVHGGSSNFTALSFGVGFAGSWTFAEYERVLATQKPVLFGSQTVDYSYWIVRFGISLPLL